MSKAPLLPPAEMQRRTGNRPSASGIDLLRQRWQRIKYILNRVKQSSEKSCKDLSGEDLEKEKAGLDLLNSWISQIEGSLRNIDNGLNAAFLPHLEILSKHQNCLLKYISIRQNDQLYDFNHAKVISKFINECVKFQNGESPASFLIPIMTFHEYAKGTGARIVRELLPAKKDPNFAARWMTKQNRTPPFVQTWLKALEEQKEPGRSRGNR